MTKPKRRVHVVDPDERIGPTPETKAKLILEPFEQLRRDGLLDEGQITALLEIRDIYRAIIGGSAVRTMDLLSSRAHGSHGMSDVTAWKHKELYLPWRAANGKNACRLVLDLGHYGQAPQRAYLVSGAVRWKLDMDKMGTIAYALTDYRRRMLLTRPPRY